MEVLAIAVACGLLGLLAGRRWVLGVVIALWAGIAVFLVLNDGWEGNGWGDGGVALTAVAAVLSLLLAAAGVRLRAGRSARMSG